MQPCTHEPQQTQLSLFSLFGWKRSTAVATPAPCMPMSTSVELTASIADDRLPLKLIRCTSAMSPYFPSMAEMISCSLVMAREVHVSLGREISLICMRPLDACTQSTQPSRSQNASP